MDTQTRIDNLNKDLAEELAAVIQYTVYAAKVTGPDRPQLQQFFGLSTHEPMQCLRAANASALYWPSPEEFATLWHLQSGTAARERVAFKELTNLRQTYRNATRNEPIQHRDFCPRLKDFPY